MENNFNSFNDVYDQLSEAAESWPEVSVLDSSDDPGEAVYTTYIEIDNPDIEEVVSVQCSVYAWENRDGDIEVEVEDLSRWKRETGEIGFVDEDNNDVPTEEIMKKYNLSEEQIDKIFNAAEQLAKQATADRAENDAYNGFLKVRGD